MRWFHLAVIILFAAVTATFAMQNFQIVTVSFLRIGAQMALAFLVAIIYLLGAATPAAACSRCCGGPWRGRTTDICYLPLN